jgi:hypothetical protein
MRDNPNENQSSANIDIKKLVAQKTPEATSTKPTHDPMTNPATKGALPLANSTNNIPTTTTKNGRKPKIKISKEDEFYKKINGGWFGSLGVTQAGITAALDEHNKPIAPIPEFPQSKLAAKICPPGPDGRVTSVITPEGVTLNLVADYGYVKIFRERQPVCEKTTYSGFTPVEFSIEITPEDLKAGHEKRNKTQNIVKGINADDVAVKAEAKNHPKEKWCWGHKIAYQFIGNKGQEDENLVAITKNANISMFIMMEQHIAELVRLNQSLKIEGRAWMDCQYDVACLIEYTLKTPKGQAVYMEFNGKEKNPPSYLDGLYVEKQLFPARDTSKSLSTTLAEKESLKPSFIDRIIRGRSNSCASYLDK